jgi:hypothetical protein
MILRVAALLSIAIVRSALAADEADAVAYSRCTEAARNPKTEPKQALAACAGPAAQGVPGAQYAMGAILLNSANGEVSPDASMWLEKAVASGHAGAAYVLAQLLASKGQTADRARVSDLMILSACGGYKPALADFEKVNKTEEQLPCSPRADTDFSGEWIGAVKWSKSGPVSAADASTDVRIVIRQGQPHVFMKYRDWMEVKPGKWRLSQLDETMILSSLDSGSDFDGIWIEAWDFHLLRLNADEAAVSYMRTVNNRDMPASLSWRTFTTTAQGHIRRSSK